jgi:hypothetical protein
MSTDSTTQFNLSQLSEMKAWFEKELASLRSPAKADDTSSTLDAVGSRDVTKQARAAAKSASTQSAVSFAPRGKSAFHKEPSASANSIRLLLGADPFYTNRYHLERNWFVPSAQSAYDLLHEMNVVMNTTDKFTRASDIWHPLLTLTYVGVIWTMRTLQCMEQAGRLNAENGYFVDSFFRAFPENTLPIPGPLVNFISGIANSSPALNDYQDVEPYLPDTPGSSTAHLYKLVGDLALRIPNVPILLNQYRRVVTAALAGAPPAQVNISRWSEFAQLLGSGANTEQVLGPAAVPAVPPASPFDMIAMTAPGNVSHQALLASPGFRYPIQSLTRVSDNIFQYRDEILATFPDTPAAAAAPLSWEQWLRLDGDRQWFVSTIASMADYCKYWASSCSLGDIPIVGSSVGQTESSTTVAIQVPTRRFGVGAAAAPARFTDLHYNMVSYTEAQPEADRLDAAVAQLNVSSTNLTLPMPATPLQANTDGNHGPVFNDLPARMSARDVHVRAGMGSNVRTYYHNANPRLPQ